MTTLLFLLKNTLLEFGFFFGVLIVGGGILTILSRSTNRALQASRFPGFGFYFFGFIGIPVHEFCHAFFCKLFLHDVKKVKWFDPKSKGGASGSVTHTYNPWNPYHRIGHFFIGMGPVILSPLLLALLFYFLVPSGRGLFHVDIFSSSGMKATILRAIHAIFRRSTFSTPGFYVFLYLSLCVSSQMELSGEDIKQAANGILPLILLLTLINAMAWIFHFSWHHRAIHAGTLFLTAAACVFTFAALLSSINLILIKGACLLFSGGASTTAGAKTTARS